MKGKAKSRQKLRKGENVEDTELEIKKRKSRYVVREKERLLKCH